MGQGTMSQGVIAGDFLAWFSISGDWQTPVYPLCISTYT